eukprot:CAMPEP_0114261806 /NCGR_PEP_ID=MMETSP0058-20121206/21371_1 /TAXON_ID=36894 /ORGANISM="Pyramimonas parkeae, CCMP726" /LENGTH=265 /DNA_ID=CAMNT_0001377441 /DNA_START=395 /DNA_END=1192 /DNA_ORIENTATION=+
MLVASNRDEYYSRPALPAHFWEDEPDVFAGRDKEAGGTWFGISRGGRMALITNFREMTTVAGAPSRGDLTLNFLRSPAGTSPMQYLQSVIASQKVYNGYNLVVADLHSKQAAYLTNRGDPSQAGPRQLAPGIYGLSNAVLDSPWPKLELGKSSLQTMLNKSSGEPLSLKLIVDQVLCDMSTVEDAHLPETGAPLEVEKALMSAFVNTTFPKGRYGTSTQTVMAARRDGIVEWHERFLDTCGASQAWQETDHQINLRSEHCVEKAA